MAFPQVVGTNTGNTGGNVTNFNVTLPTVSGGIQANDICLIAVSSDGNPEVTISDWATVSYVLLNPSPRLKVGWKRMSGGEDGQTVACTYGASESGGWVVYVIRGAHTTTPPNGQTGTEGTNGTDNAPDPNSYNPPDWDIEDALWIALCAWDGNRSCSNNGGDNFVTDRVAASTGSGVAMSTHNQNVNAFYDPPAFTLSGADEWRAISVAIRPAPSGPATVESGPLSIALAPAITSARQKVAARSSAVALSPAISAQGRNATERRSAAVALAPTITTSGLRIVSRSAAIGLGLGIETTGAKQVTRSASFALATSIESSGAVTRVQSRSASFALATSIEAAGEHTHIYERSVAIALAPAIGVNGSVIRERQAALALATTITAAGRRDLLRNATLALTTSIEAAGVKVGGVQTIERSASFNLATSIATAGLLIHCRKVWIGLDDPFPSTSVIDDFNRADMGPPLGGDWIPGIENNDSRGLAIRSERLENTYAQDAGEVWNHSYGDQEVHAKIEFTNPGSQIFIWGAVQPEAMGGFPMSGYCAFHTSNGIYIIDSTAGDFNFYKFAENASVASGDSLGLRIAGGIVSLWHKPAAGSWTMLGRIVDSSYTSGSGPGIEIALGNVDDPGGGAFNGSRVNVNGQRILQRSASLALATDISATGQTARVLERSASIALGSAISAAGEIAGKIERAASIELTSAISASGQRVLQRSASIGLNTAVGSRGARDLMRTASVSMSPTIGTNGATTHVRTASATIALGTAISVSGRASVAIERSVSIALTSSITAAGLISKDRGVSIALALDIATVCQAEYNRTVAIDGDLTIDAAAQRELMRAVSFDLPGRITVALPMRTIVVMLKHAQAVDVQLLDAQAVDVQLHATREPRT